MLLDVSGTVADIERGLPRDVAHVSASDGEAHVLRAGRRAVGGSGGSDFEHQRIGQLFAAAPALVVKPLVQRPSGVAECRFGPGGTYMGKDFRAAYVPETTLNGAGQSRGAAAI